jgi:hypothetical protein
MANASSKLSFHSLLSERDDVLCGQVDAERAVVQQTTPRLGVFLGG